ncbi:hypothetical protein WG899_12085 [Paucibacter sp. AS339]|uniref:hypothetical protein n=1 Tax=Paucibacter hankyongi TaxID=3133434 RepID=UPI0030AFD23D
MDKQAAHINTSPRLRPLLALMTLSAAALLSACGGGGGGGGEVTPPPPVDAAELAVLVKPISSPTPSNSTSQPVATIKLTNVGKGVAETTDFNITADADLESLKVVKCTTDNPASACPGLGSRMTVSKLQPGTSLTFEVAGLLKLGTSKVINMGASASTTNSGQVSNANHSVGFKVYSVDAAVQATGPSTAVPAGGSFNYVVTVTNKGPDAATDVSLGTDLLSNPTAPILGTISCSASGGAVCPTELKVGVMNIPNLPKDASLVITLPYQFAPGVTQGLRFNTSVRTAADTDSSNDSFLVITP